MLKTSNKIETKTARDASYALIVFKFLSFWVFSLVILFFIALLVDINWARPQMQKIMATSLHRKVSLGRLTWNLGFNGLSIATDHIAIAETDGEPFLAAKQSEIGIAFWQLLSGKLIIHYMDLNDPVLWAIKLDNNRWNFSDLLQEQVDIRFFQIDSGHLHILDLGSGKSTKAVQSDLNSQCWPSYDLENLKLKLVWPRKAHRWPVFLSFDVNHPGYKTQVRLSGLGHGLVSDWQNNKYRFDLDAENINALDLAPFGFLPPGTGGIINVQAKGEGSLAKALHAKIAFSAKSLNLPTDLCGTLSADATKGTGEFRIDKENIEWQDLDIVQGQFAVHAKGTLYNWQNHKQEDSVTKPAHPFWDMLGSLGLKKAKPISRPPGLEIESSFAATLPEAASTSRLPNFLNQKKLPWLTFLVPKKPPSLKGELELFGDRNDPKAQKLVFPQLTLVLGDSALQGSGNFDTKQAAFSFSGNKLPLSDLWQQVSSLFLAKSFPSANEMHLSGRVDLEGQVASSSGKTRSRISSKLSDASLEWKAPDGRLLSLNKLSGALSLTGDSVSLDKVAGTAGDGVFELSGTTSDKQCHFSLNAKHLDLANLNEALKLFQISMPPLTDGHIKGTAANLNLEAFGNPERPQVKLTCEPEELYYQPAGLGRPLKAVSGLIEYEGDILSLKDVLLVGHGGKVSTSFAIDHLSGNSNLEYVKCKTQQADLSELNYFLGSALLPPKMQKDYLNFLSEWHVSEPQGRVSGDISWRPDGKDGQWHGQVNFANSSLRLSEKAYLLEHLNGAFCLQGSDLVVQNCVGALDNSSFTLSGLVKNWQAENYTVQANVHAELMASDCQKYISALTASDSKKITLVSAHPISLQAKASGTATDTTVNFELSADRGDNFVLKTPGFEFYQPPGQEISAHGNLGIDWAKNLRLALRSTHIVLASDQFDGQGSLNFQTNASYPDIEFNLATTKPASTQTLAYCLGLDKAADYKGKTTFDLKFTGVLNEPEIGGTMTFSEAGLPALNMKSVSGTATATNWPLSASAHHQGAATFSLSLLRYGNISFQNISSALTISPESLLTVNHLEATFGQGEVKGSGWLDLHTHKVHASCQMKQIDSDTLSRQVFDSPGELQGRSDLEFTIDADAQTKTQLMETLSGTGRFTITQGRIARFGRLQERLTQSNLVHEGLFGFNLNNLLQSVVPVRTGEFKQLSGTLSANEGTIALSDLHYSGDDMRLWAAGKVSLPLNTVSMEIDGTIPRVSSSLLTGTFGEVSKGFTIQKMVDVVTMHKLESLPDFPVLGKLASESQRAFSFRVVAPLSQPEAMAKSIEKSFHWLPTRPNASAHPLPAM